MLGVKNVKVGKVWRKSYEASIKAVEKGMLGVGH